MFSWKILPGVLFSDKKKLPQTPGIYFIHSGEQLDYIGKAVNIYSRHNEQLHHIHEELDLNDFYQIKYLVLEVAESVLYDAEEFFIRQFNPSLNRHRRGISIEPDIIKKLLEVEMELAIKPVTPQEKETITSNFQEITATETYKTAFKERMNKENSSFFKNCYELTESQKEFINSIISCIPALEPSKVIDVALACLRSQLSEYGYTGLPEYSSAVTTEQIIPAVFQDARYLEALEYLTVKFPERSDIEQILFATFARTSKGLTAVDCATAQAYIRLQKSC